MTITIQVDDKGTVTATPGTDSSVASASATASANDGGAPRVGGVTGGSDSPAGNTMDIGGPPQWLSDALSSKGNAGATASADSNGGSDGQDGGAGPSF